MKTVRLILFFFLLAVAFLTSETASRASSSEPEQARQSSYLQKSGTPTANASPGAGTIIPTATKIPHPTSTPIPTPPPSDPDTTSKMVLFGVVLFAIIYFGMVINTRRLF